MSGKPTQPKAPSGFTLHRKLDGHDKQICRFAWSRDGNKLATPSYDKTIRIWNWQDGTFLELEGHTKVVTGVSWSPDGRMLASSSDDPSVKIWDTHTGACLSTLPHAAIITGVSWSPKEPKVATSSDDFGVRIWDVADPKNGRLLHETREHTDRALGIAWSFQGDLLASASWDGTVRLWTADGAGYGRPYSRNTERLYNVAWSHDGRIATGCTDGTIALWDARSGRQLPLLKHKHEGAIFGIAFSPDSKFLATKAADNTLRLWRCDTWDFVELESAAQWPYSCVVFHPSLPILATASDNERTIDLWDLDYDLIFPNWVPQPPSSRDDLYILHLSDVHIGASDPIGHSIQLTADLTYNLKTKRLHYLVISGDFTDAATVKEYEKAAKLINLIAQKFSVSKERLILAPGNHDVSWDSAEAAYHLKFMRHFKHPPLEDPNYIKAGEIGYLVRDDELYKKRFDNFRAFYEQVCGRPYPLEYAHQGIIHAFPEDRILFLSLNSSWQVDNFYRSRCSINMEALSNALYHVLNTEYADWLKIAVWHHPVTGMEPMNAAFLQQLTVNNFQLVLHGHIHRSLEEYHKYDRNRGIQITGAGTFGAPASQMVPGIPLSYNLLALSPEKRVVTVHTRKKEDAEGAWSAYAQWGDKNNPKPSYSFNLR